MKNIKKKEYLLYLIILILFIVLSTMISFKHEYWADEAFAWLIARDASIIDIFKTEAALSGHPILFFLIIKSFQILGLTYKYFHIISILFSTLGVALFLWKSDFKWYIKCLIPFTFFIFYQFTIVTRGYCLILFLLSLLAIIWNKKEEHYYLFILILIALLSLESYTFLIAGSIFLLEIINFIKKYKKIENKKKYFISFTILFLSFLLTTIYMFPRSNNIEGVGKMFKALSLDDAFLYSSSMPTIFKFIFLFLIIITIVVIYLKQNKKRELLETSIIFIPAYIFFEFFYNNYWHSGIFFLLFIFLSWIHNINKDKLFNYFMLLTCVVQIFWSVKSSINDYKNVYSPTEEISEYIKQYDYDNLVIYGQNYITVAINPYFNHNIFDLWYNDYSFYYFGKENPNNLFSYETKDILEKNPDIFIAAYHEGQKEIEKGHDKYKELEKNYTMKKFTGNAFFKDTTIKDFEYDVYIKKEIAK